jgi:membrane-associated protease RseP (regulator of RpoE activity)
MFRNTLFAALAGLGLMTWGAAPSFAQAGPLTRLKPDQPQLYLKQSALLVTQVLPGSTAAQQGIEPGDVIVSVNGNPVRSLTDLHYWVGRSGPVAQLQVIDCNTGWPNQVMVYPQNGRIGVDVIPTPLDGVGPVRPVYPPWGPPVPPIRPIYPPWGNPVRPLPLPVNPGNPGMHPLPWPPPGGNPGVFPGR